MHHFLWGSWCILSAFNGCCRRAGMLEEALKTKLNPAGIRAAQQKQITCQPNRLLSLLHLPHVSDVCPTFLFRDVESQSPQNNGAAQTSLWMSQGAESACVFARNYFIPEDIKLNNVGFFFYACQPRSDWTAHARKLPERKRIDWTGSKTVHTLNIYILL